MKTQVLKLVRVNVYNLTIVLKKTHRSVTSWMIQIHQNSKTQEAKIIYVHIVAYQIK